MFLTFLIDLFSLVYRLPPCLPRSRVSFQQIRTFRQSLNVRETQGFGLKKDGSQGFGLTSSGNKKAKIRVELKKPENGAKKENGSQRRSPGEEVKMLGKTFVYTLVVGYHIIYIDLL